MRFSQGGTIRGSINLPAQSLWPTIPALYEMFKAANLRRVIWYCGRSPPALYFPQFFKLTLAGSSRGRGNRAASWFADYIAEKGDGGMNSLVLLGGIKGWVTAGGEYIQWVDEYDEAVWCKGDQ